MMRKYVEQAVQRIGSSGLAVVNTLEGCTNEESGQLEAEIGTTLPQAYKAFLSLCGKGAGKFLVGTDWTYPKLLEVKPAAIELLRSSRVAASLPPTSFVFAMHQGYQFLYFDCDVGHDPPVYLFLEGEDSPRQVFGSFTQWLSQCVDDEIATWADLQ